MLQHNTNSRHKYEYKYELLAAGCKQLAPQFVIKKSCKEAGHNHINEVNVATPIFTQSHRLHTHPHTHKTWCLRLKTRVSLLAFHAS